jgi:hypothetical protein
LVLADLDVEDALVAFDGREVGLGRWARTPAMVALNSLSVRPRVAWAAINDEAVLSRDWIASS